MYQSPGHEHVGDDLHPIVFCARIDQMHRYDAAEHLRTNMRRLGIPVEYVTGNANQLYTKVIEEKDYHIYTGGQFTWRFPIAFSLLGFRVMLEFLAPKIMETTPLTGWREWITGLQEKKIKQYLEEGVSAGPAPPSPRA